MGKISIGQKAERLLKLLLGLRNPRIAEALRQYGFKDADLAEGWRRLQALTERRLLTRAPAKQDPALLRQLDEWENHWFPVASASLKARFPDVHAYLFLNLSQTEGPGVVISVGTFVQRLDELGAEPSLAVASGPARELLAARGLNDATVQIAKRILDALGTTAPAQPAPAPDLAEQAAAEQAMWEWYLEWGEITRVAVSDRKLLRELGFLNYRRPLAEEAPELEEVEAPVSPPVAV